jgi:type II pantothenate kinase
MATGGGAHLFYDRLVEDLGVEVRREEEMECLILGLGFVARIPQEVFWYSEELVYKVSHTGAPRPTEPKTIPASELPRPSPTPPAYQVSFAPTSADAEAAAQFPCLVVNIGSGVSIVKVDEDGGFERVSGTSLGGGTLWGLLSLLTDARTFDGMSLSLLPVSCSFRDRHQVVLVETINRVRLGADTRLGRNVASLRIWR